MIMNIKYIFFDCMETLIDLHHLPKLKDYAQWAYAGSGAESLWKDFNDFYNAYIAARNDLTAAMPEHAEYEMRGRFFNLVQRSLPGLSKGMLEETTDKLYRNYWNNYKAECYIREDVMEALPKLGSFCKLGVVSNFMVGGGIEELLVMMGIRSYFSFVVTSVSEGWRKPHIEIYKRAIDISGSQPDRIMFIGDDYLNDYIMPTELGMRAVLLDRHDRRPELENRITDFSQVSKLSEFSENDRGKTIEICPESCISRYDQKE